MPRPVGIRIRHDTEVAPAIIAVEIPGRPYPVPYVCGLCKVYPANKPPHPLIHQNKAHHLHLEGDGSCIVSEGVYSQMKEPGLEALGFSYVNDVNEPPPINLGFGSDGRLHREPPKPQIIHVDVGG